MHRVAVGAHLCQGRDMGRLHISNRIAKISCRCRKPPQFLKLRKNSHFEKEISVHAQLTTHPKIRYQRNSRKTSLQSC
jgi:hypothetical protein